MNKAGLIFSALCAILILSCARELPEDGGQDVIGEGVPLTAVAADPMPTKAAIDDGTGVFTWTEGDQLAVFAEHEKYGKRYYFAKLPSEETGKTISTFKLDYYGERRNFAVYPATYSLDSYSTASDLRITIPANYKMSVSAPALYPPMVAVNEEGQDLDFRHVCGLLRLTLNQVPVNTRRIKLWMGENIVGIYQVDVSDPDHPFVSLENPVAAGSSKDVTFTLNTAVTASTRDGIILNVPLPQGTYWNLALTFYTDLTSTVYNQFRLYRGKKRVIKAGSGYHETIDCSAAVKKNLWSVSIPATSVAWGSTSAVNTTVEITDGGSGSGLSGESAIALDYEVTSFSEDPSIATVYVQPVSTGGSSADAKYQFQTVITGVNPGETYVRARVRYGNNYLWSARTKITVYSNNTSYMPAVKYPRVMAVGDRYQLSASLQGNFEFRNYTWEQLDGYDYATLSAGGLLTATAPGSVRVLCTVNTNEGSVEKYPFTVRIVSNPPGTLRGVFTSSINGDVVFFSRGNLIYYKENLGNGVYEAYDNTYDPDNMNGHFEFMSPQYDFYSGRYNCALISRNFVPAFDVFNYRLPMNYFSDSQSTRPVEVDGDETTGWHAPTRHQWEFIMTGRPCSTVGGTANARFAKATISFLPIKDIPGVIIFPDNYTHPEGVPLPIGINSGSYAFTNNRYSAAEWEMMEQEGAVFLPNRGTNTSSSSTSSRLRENALMNVSYDNDTMGLYWDNVPVKGESDGKFGYYYLYKEYLGWAENGKTEGDRKVFALNLRLVKDLE